jgi:hypothetical protein
MKLVSKNIAFFKNLLDLIVFDLTMYSCKVQCNKKTSIYFNLF